MLFLKQGRIKQEINAKQINGQIWIMDQDNFTDIIGYFKQGYCENAQIYTLKQVKIHNISIKISNQNQVLMGGSEVEQINSQVILYRGGYRGYQRFGFGTIYYNQQGNDYEEWGYWHASKQQGKFIKQHYTMHNQYSIIEYKQATWTQRKLRIENNQQIKMDIISDNGIVSNQYLSQDQYQQLIQSISTYKRQLEQRHKQQTFIVPLKLYTITYHKFDNKQLQNIQMLTHDQCELYLQYLFHQKENQLLKRTVIIGLYVIDTQYKINQNKHSYKYKKQISRLMQKYQNKYQLLGGFWERVVIPLVLTNVNDHYSFAILNIAEMKCTYYNSFHFVDTTLYNTLIRQFLMNEASKSNNNYNDDRINNMKFQSSTDIPPQFDVVSCGFYMLQGISQLLQKQKICFTNNELSAIKQKIIAKLKDINK